MVVYENFFLKFSQNFLSKGRLENKFLIVNHYKTIFWSVRIACSSYTVYYTMNSTAIQTTAVLLVKITTCFCDLLLSRCDTWNCLNPWHTTVGSLHWLNDFCQAIISVVLLDPLLPWHVSLLQSVISRVKSHGGCDVLAEVTSWRMWRNGGCDVMTTWANQTSLRNMVTFAYCEELKLYFKYNFTRPRKSWLYGWFTEQFCLSV